MQNDLIWHISLPNMWLKQLSSEGCGGHPQDLDLVPATECLRGTASKGIAMFDTNFAVANREQQMPKVPSCKIAIFYKTVTGVCGELWTVSWEIFMCTTDRGCLLNISWNSPQLNICPNCTLSWEFTYFSKIHFNVIVLSVPLFPTWFRFMTWFQENFLSLHIYPVHATCPASLILHFFAQRIYGQYSHGG